MVSIIMNCYNSEQYLEEALSSIFAQSYQDFEVVFLDNCSIDNSPNIAKKYGEKVKYYCTAKNIPLGEARNEAVSKCKGDYITFLDCDDLWEPNKLETQVKIMTDNPDCVLCMSNYYCINMVNNSKNIYHEYKGNEEKKELSFEQFATDYCYAMSSFIVRKNCVDLLPFAFDGRLSFAEEYDFFLRVASFGKLIYCPKPLCAYRVHETMHSRKLRKSIPDEYDIVLTNLKNHYKNFEEKYAAVKKYIEFQRDFTKTKIYIEEKNNKSARETIKPYRKYSKKAKAFYTLSFFPRWLSYKIYSFMYRARI